MWVSVGERAAEGDAVRDSENVMVGEPDCERSVDSVPEGVQLNERLPVGFFESEFVSDSDRDGDQLCVGSATFECVFVSEKDVVCVHVGVVVALQLVECVLWPVNEVDAVSVSVRSTDGVPDSVGVCEGDGLALLERESDHVAGATLDAVRVAEKEKETDWLAEAVHER